MSAAPRFPLAFVVGVAHCGSTLLGRTLGMHPRVLCVGELMRLGSALSKELSCGCGELLGDCPFWSQRLEGIRAATDYDAARFDPELYARLGASTGAEVVVDLSKTLVWRVARRWRDPGFGVVLLVRDSRGILASAARAGKDLRQPLKKHEKWTGRLTRWTDRLGDRALVVHYEDLCTEPEPELRRVCNFLGLDFDEAVLRPADAVHHFVHSSTSGYLRGSNEIRLDERWRRELPAEERARIERMMERVPLLRERYLGAGAR